MFLLTLFFLSSNCLSVRSFFCRTACSLTCKHLHFVPILMNCCRFIEKKNWEKTIDGDLQKRKDFFLFILDWWWFSKWCIFKWNISLRSDRFMQWNKNLGIWNESQAAKVAHFTTYTHTATTTTLSDILIAMTLRSWERCYYTHTVAIKLWKILSHFVVKMAFALVVILPNVECYTAQAAHKYKERAKKATTTYAKRIICKRQNSVRAKHNKAVHII